MAVVVSLPDVYPCPSDRTLPTTSVTVPRTTMVSPRPRSGPPAIQSPIQSAGSRAVKRPFDRRGSRAFDARKVEVVDRARSGRACPSARLARCANQCRSRGCEPGSESRPPIRRSGARLTCERVRVSEEARDQIVQARIIAADMSRGQFRALEGANNSGVSGGIDWPSACHEIAGRITGHAASDSRVVGTPGMVVGAMVTTSDGNHFRHVRAVSDTRWRRESDTWSVRSWLR